MRRTPLIAATAVALAVTASAASADVTDVLAVPSVAGSLTLAGAGAGTAVAPVGTATSATIGAATGAITGAVLTVTDARGITGASGGWDVTATYAPLAAGVLATVPLPSGVLTRADLGGAAVSVTASDALTAATNAVTGVAAASLTKATGASLSSPVTLAATGSDGRGVTAFGTSYSITLPAKSASAATLYTGSIVYTVAPRP